MPRRKHVPNKWCVPNTHVYTIIIFPQSNNVAFIIQFSTDTMYTCTNQGWRPIEGSVITVRWLHSNVRCHFKSCFLQSLFVPQHHRKAIAKHNAIAGFFWQRYYSILFLCGRDIEYTYMFIDLREAFSAQISWQTQR